MKMLINFLAVVAVVVDQCCDAMRQLLLVVRRCCGLWFLLLI